MPWFCDISRVQRALVGFAVGTFIFLSGGFLDWFVTRQYLPRMSSDVRFSPTAAYR